MLYNAANQNETQKSGVCGGGVGCGDGGGKK